MNKLPSNPNKLFKAAAAALILLAIAVSLTAYPLPAQAQTLSTDATLSGLTVSPKNIIGFSSGRYAYDVGVDSTVTEATITATPTDSNAEVSFDSQDSNDVTDGHQVALSAGRNTVTITVTAEDNIATQDYTVSVNQSVSGDYGWRAQDDLDGLEAASIGIPFGIWSNSTTIWVVDTDAVKAFAYNHDGTRDGDRDFGFDSNHQAATGAWSDGEYAWIADSGDDKLYVYEVATGTRQNSREFDLDTENVSATGVWSDGATIWVADDFVNKIFAYALDGGVRQDGDDIDLASDNDVGGGIWSDGATIWVSQKLETNPKIFAYVLDSGARVEGRDFNTLQAAGASQPAGLWSDGETMWVVDVTENNNKVYAFNQPPAANDPTLSDLTVSPRDIIGFAADRTSYEVGVDSTVTEATVAATATNSNADVFFDPRDAVSTTPGYQVALSAGRNTVTLTVTAEDDVTTQAYEVNINRGVSDNYGWNAERDLDAVVFEHAFARDDKPIGIVENNGIFWITSSLARNILAYRQDGSRFPSRDTTRNAANTDIRGMWTDGQTLWTDDDQDDKLYVYQLSDGSRQHSQEFDLHTDNDEPRGIWSDGTTMWVADDDEDSLYAYLLSDGNPLESKGFDLDSSNDDPEGIWSDGYTIWVADATDDKLYAYALQGGQRQAGRDFNTLSGAGNTTVADITSDGRTMWGVDFDGRKVFSYNMPPSANANLSSLTLSPRDIIGFAPDRTSYQRGVAGSVGTATITAAADHPAATVGFSTTDADPVAPGHQVDLSAGRNTVTVTVTAEDDSTRAYTVTINRGVRAQYGWKADDDLDELITAGNRGPRGIWANSTTFYISDFNGDKVYAYNRDGTRDDTKDFDTTGSTFPNGIWSDGTTLWVADSASMTLFAYTLSNGNRNTGAEITLANSARGVWGNSTTIWAVNDTTDKLEAYQRSDGTDDNDKDISLHADNGDPAGIWSDGTTIWVADHVDDKLYAYTLSGGARDMTKDIDTSTSGNENPRGLWGEGDTIWVTDEDDDRVYSYNLQERRNSDATLSALTVSPKDITGFVAERTEYEVGVASTVTRATVTATLNDPTASVDYSGTDVDLVTDGHQVDLSAGRNEVTVMVTAEDDSTQNYTVSINRGVTDDYGWNAEDDLDGLIAAENQNPTGVWGNGATLWVSDGEDDKLYAYNADGTRDATQDFNTLAAANNNTPGGIWSNGVTMWVADNNAGRIFAYRMADKQRDSAKEFTNLAAGNSSPSDLWSDGTTMWVSDLNTYQIFAYRMSDRQPDATRGFTSLDADNNHPSGIWSDGLTMWTGDYGDDKLYAYDMATRAHLESRDFNTPNAARNYSIEGIWSDGTTMWVPDYNGGKVYAYNMPPSNDARISSLTVSPKNIIGFATDRTSYQVGVASTVSQATVTGTPNDPNASVDYSGTDADLVAGGHQVDLSAGRNEVTVTVTAEDGITTSSTYTVSINQGVDTPYGWNAEHDLDGLVLGVVHDLTDRPAGIAESGGIFWITSQFSRNILAYQQDGSRLSSRDITAHSNNGEPTYLWTNGETLWSTDADDDRLYAYQLSDGSRQNSREFDLNTNNTRAAGIWSNGTTIWVADREDDKVYAYTLDGGARQGTREFDLHSNNEAPTGIWSDGYTIWVGDATDEKLYAYTLRNGERNTSRDFTTLSAAQNQHATDTGPTGPPCGWWTTTTTRSIPTIYPPATTPPSPT